MSYTKQILISTSQSTGTQYLNKSTWNIGKSIQLWDGVLLLMPTLDVKFI